MASGIIINEDNSHFLAARSPEQMNLAGLHAFVDQYADTQVTHLFLCPNAMRANFRSHTREAIWDDNLPAQQPAADDTPGAAGWVGSRWVANAKLLHDRGLDMYAVWIDRCRARGLSPWLSMRMNDVHDTDNPQNFMHSSFWKRHPEYWRVPGSPRGYADRALDYAIPAVREHALAFIGELLERYAPDGLELDWMRFGYHFRPGCEAAGRPILLDFHHQVRRLTRHWSEKRGREIKLAVRVPAQPQYARELGMDAVAWVQEDLIDMLVPTPFWTTADFDIPLGLWRDLLGPAGRRVKLAPCMEVRIQPFPAAPAAHNTIETMRGFAAAMLHRQADHIYLFNHMDCDTTPRGDYRPFLTEPGSLATLLDKPRRHPCTYVDTVPPGVPRGGPLPQPVNALNPAQVRLALGPAPKTGRVLLRFGLAPGENLDALVCRARLNSVACTSLADLPAGEDFPAAARILQFAAPLDAAHDDYNLLELWTTEDGPAQQLTWAELAVLPE